MSGRLAPEAPHSSNQEGTLMIHRRLMPRQEASVQQSQLAKAVKRARVQNLLPFVIKDN